MKNKYRKNIRHPHFDYTTNTGYFITIVTNNRKNYFGSIKNENIILNKYGLLLESMLLDLPFTSFNIELYEYIIMPNHIHAVFLLNNTLNNQQTLPYIIR